jgi:hypothetical protein
MGYYLFVFKGFKKCGWERWIREMEIRILDD